MLALIAGSGALPAEVARAAKPDLIANVHGAMPHGLDTSMSFRLEKLGSFLAKLRSKGVTEVCFAGGVERPEISLTAIDARTLQYVPRMMSAMREGDDTALRTLLGIFEEAGFRIRAAHDLAPHLLPEAGLSVGRLYEGAEADASRAEAVIAAMGSVDVGQGCVVRKGQVLALEGKFGTDWMLQSLRARPDNGGGLLMKAPKPTQDRRVDLPAIGPETVAGAASAGLEGIVIKAGGVMMLAPQAVREAAEEAGIFIWVRP